MVNGIVAVATEMAHHAPPADAASKTDDTVESVEERTTGLERTSTLLSTASSENGSASSNHQTAFREMLKHPSAKPVIADIHRFIEQFPAGLARQDAARRVHRFLSATQDWMLSEVLVFAADADEEGKNNAAEGLEKFVLQKLWRKHGPNFGMDPGDEEEDIRLRWQIAGLSWVSFENLGIPPVEPSLLELAIGQLQDIERWKAPKDKLVCILNACRVINDVLKRTRAEGGRPLAADDFLPLLIYTMIQANPPRLHSNMEYIATFRHPSRLVAEDAYFLTALQSSVAFAKDAGPKSLDVTPEEFERRFAQAQREARQREPDTLLAEEDGVAGASANDRRMACGPDSSSDAVTPAAPSTVAQKASSLSAAQHAQLVARRKALPLRFEAIQSARQLRVKDIAVLLEEYREMVRILRDLDQPPASLDATSPKATSGRKSPPSSAQDLSR